MVVRATHHLTSNPATLHFSMPYLGHETVIVGNGISLVIKHLGSSTMTVNDSVLHLHKILHTPRVPSNLLFVYHLCVDNDLSVEFSANSFSVKKAHTERILAQGGDMLQHLASGMSSSINSPQVYTSSINNSGCCTRSAHPSSKVLNLLVHQSLLPKHIRWQKDKVVLLAKAQVHLQIRPQS